LEWNNWGSEFKLLIIMHDFNDMQEPIFLYRRLLFYSHKCKTNTECTNDVTSLTHHPRDSPQTPCTSRFGWTEFGWNRRKFFLGKAFEILKFELWVRSEDAREMSQQVIGIKSWFSSSQTIKRQVVKVYGTHVNKYKKLYIYANAFYSDSSLDLIATLCFYNR
jgi:hypothetical protein